MALTPTNNPWHIDVAPIAGQLVLGDTNPGSIQWVSASQSVSEGAGTVTVIAERSGGSDGAVGASYATSDGSATAGDDYQADSGTLSWADGESGQKSVTLTINQDTEVESDETFDVTLSSPTNGATLGGTTTHTVTITDDDSSGGGMSSPEPDYSASGSFSHGNTVTISKSGGGFGSKITQAPVIWDMGGDVRINGVAHSEHADAADGTSVASAGLFNEKNSAIYTQFSERHSHVDRHYASQDGSMTAMVGYDPVLNTDSSSRRYFAAFKRRIPCTLKYVRSAVYTNLSGTFDVGEAGYLGESITLTINGSDYQGSIISVDAPEAGHIAVYSPNNYFTSSDGPIDIVGNSSGATATLDFDQGYNTSGSTKLWRIDQSSSDGFLAVVQDGYARSYWVEANSGGTDIIGMIRGTYKPELEDAVPDGEWAHVELYCDFSDEAAITSHFEYVGSSGVGTRSIPPQDGSPNVIDTPIQVLIMGMDSNVPHELWCESGEMYADETPQRVVIGNAATYETCTERELQYISAWSDSEIDIECYQGAMADLSGKYVYWFDVDNNPTLVGQI